MVPNAGPSQDTPGLCLALPIGSVHLWEDAGEWQRLAAQLDKAPSSIDFMENSPETQANSPEDMGVSTTLNTFPTHPTTHPHPIWRGHWVGLSRGNEGKISTIFVSLAAFNFWGRGEGRGLKCPLPRLCPLSPTPNHSAWLSDLTEAPF